MVPIREEVDKYVTEGKTLNVPSLKGDDILEKEICNLSTENIKSWFENNKHLIWDKNDLSKLKKFYIMNNETEKSEIIRLLLTLI